MNISLKIYQSLSVDRFVFIVIKNLLSFAFIDVCCSYLELNFSEFENDTNFTVEIFFFYLTNMPHFIDVVR